MFSIFPSKQLQSVKNQGPVIGKKDNCYILGKSLSV